MNASSCILMVFGLTPLAAAQGEIFGIDLRLDRSFKSRTNNLIDKFTPLSVESRSLFGIDWNADGTVLYGIDDVTFEIVTIDPDTGVSTPTGTLLTGPPNGLTGLTAAADGTTWFLSEYTGTVSNLYSGDITTGVFSRVGTLVIGTGLVVDIAINEAGDLYGLNISFDTLVSIDPMTGSGTPVGPIGVNADFAQGMDFDPTTGELYAAIYQGGGVGQFSVMDLATGAAVLQEDTTALDIEMEIAIRTPDSLVGSTFCTTNVNSTGERARISADGSCVAADNDLTITAAGLPSFVFGFFIVGPAQGLVLNPGGSSGNLCLTGGIGRYVAPGQIQNSGSGGTFSVVTNLNAVPQPLGPEGTSSGDTWNFQAWFRDTNVYGSTSNFTNGLEVQFL